MPIISTKHVIVSDTTSTTSTSFMDKLSSIFRLGSNNNPPTITIANNISSKEDGKNSSNQSVKLTEVQKENKKAAKNEEVKSRID
jgi:hypothetical protein